MATRKPKTIHYWRGELPHWQVEDGRYFVTIHLDGSIPQAGLQRIQQLGAEYRSLSAKLTERANAALELSRRIFREMEKWLDRVSPVHHLSRPEFADMVLEAVAHRCKLRIWEMFSAVLMPSHIHLFFELNNNLSLKHELEEFKRWTGHRVAQLDKGFQGRRFWQTEWFDHWSRSGEEDERILQYIRQNPAKAGLVGDVRHWPYYYSQLTRG